MPNKELQTEFSQQISYSIHSGLLAMPVAGPPGTPCSIVSVHAPFGTKTVAWRAHRTGGMPRLPDPTPQNTNEIFAGGTIKPATPARTLDNVEVLVEGIYSYLLKEPLWVHDPLAMGASPEDPTPGTNYMIRPEHFDKKLLAGADVSTPQGETVQDLGPGFIRSS